MRKIRVAMTVLLISVLTAAALSGCGTCRRADYEGTSGKISIKGQVDGGAEISRGIGGKSD